MCVILLALDSHPRYRWIVAANRDELYARPSLPSHFWEDAPQVLAGRDLRAGGSWMGVTRTGRFAALTNVREIADPPPSGRSRGELVGGFLMGSEPAEAYVGRVSAERGEFAGFNLLVGDGSGLWYLTNRGADAVAAGRALPPGVYGLSNASLDDPWPKVEEGRQRLADLLHAPKIGSEALLAILSSREPAPDDRLPDTGVGSDLERILSPLFIAGADYGTRASTVMMLDRAGELRWTERLHGPGSPPAETRAHRFRVDGRGW